MTEISQEEAEKLKESDKELASTAKSLLWSRKTPFFATFGVAVVFSIRVFACDYTEPVPAGIDFEWYGNHCGPGHGAPTKVAVDELDYACKRHDAVYRAGREADAEDETSRNDPHGEHPMSTR